MREINPASLNCVSFLFLMKKFARFALVFTTDMVGSRIDLLEPVPEKILLTLNMLKVFLTMKSTDITTVKFIAQHRKSLITDFKEH